MHSLLQVIANTAKVDVTDKPMLSSNGKGAAKLCLDLSRELVAQQGKEQKKYPIPIIILIKIKRKCKLNISSWNFAGVQTRSQR